MSNRAAIIIMTVSDQPFAEMRDEEMTEQRGAYRWYKIPLPGLSASLIEQCRELYPAGCDFNGTVFYGAVVNQAGVELGGTKSFSLRAIEKARSLNDLATTMADISANVLKGE